MQQNISQREISSLSGADRATVRAASVFLAFSKVVTKDFQNHPWKAVVCAPIPEIPPGRLPATLILTALWYVFAQTNETRQGRKLLVEAFTDTAVSEQFGHCIDVEYKLNTSDLFKAVAKGVKDHMNIMSELLLSKMPTKKDRFISLNLENHNR